MKKLKIVLKVIFMSESEKTSILKTAAKVGGITSLSFDDEKSTLTVVGEVDPVVLVKQLRKAKHMVEIETVGSAEEEKKPEEEKPEEKKVEEEKKVVELPPPYYYGPNGRGPVVWVYDEPNTWCCIL